MRYGRKRRNFRKPTSKSVVQRRNRTVSRRRYRKKAPIFRTPWTKALSMSPKRKFTYNDEGFSITLSSISPSNYHMFTGNNPYDPDYTGVGVQPYGWDQVFNGNFFVDYQVRASKITVYPSTSATATVAPRLKMGIVPYEKNSLSYFEISDLRQMKGSKIYDFLTGSPHYNSGYSNYATSATVFGRTVSNDRTAVAEGNTSPANIWYWYLFFDNSNWVTDAAIMFDIKIDYYTICSIKPNINES